jgi:chromosome segregation ATPase
MTIAAALEKLTVRFRQRTITALEQVELAAKTLAAGGTVDMGGLESALVTAQLSPDDFRQRCDFHVERVAKLATLEKLGPARTKADRLDKDIAGENARHAELTAAYQKRWTSLREQADEVAREVEDSRRARDWLLDLKNAPLDLADEYRAALDAEHAAQVAIGDIERSIRDLKERHRSAVGWVEQILEQDLREIHPPSATVTKSQRDRLSAAQQAKLDEHERRRDRLAREIKEQETQLTAARADLVKAEAHLAAVRKKVLAA